MTFAHLVEHFGPGHAAFLAGVPRAMMARWLAGSTGIPHAAGALLWHLSPYGAASQAIEQENRLRTLQGLASALQRRVAWLEVELMREARRRPPGSANDPYGADPTDPRAALHGG